MTARKNLLNTPGAGKLVSGPPYQDLLAILKNELDKVGLEGVDWKALIEVAVQEGLAGQVYHALRRQGLVETGGPEVIPPAVVETLEHLYRNTQVINITMREDLLKVLRILTAAGHPVLVLKGAALSELVYRDVGLRPMNDLDLLVRSDDSQTVMSLLVESGYQRVVRPESRPGFDRMFRAEMAFFSPGLYKYVVDVHWHLIEPLFLCRHVDYHAVWRRAVPECLVGHTVAVLGPEDWVLLQAAHAYYKHRHIRLCDLVDLDCLVRHLGDSLDWDRLLEIGAEFHWLPAVAAFLPACVELLETPVPERILRGAAANRLPLLERALLNWWLAPDRPERGYLLANWLFLPSWKQRAAVLWALLFPDRAYLNAYYPNQSGWRFPLLYLRYWWDELRS
jgi:hypothetical protein